MYVDIRSTECDWPGYWCDLLGDFLCALSPAGQITRVNTVWRDKLGMAPYASSPLSFLELIHPEDRANASRALARVNPGADTITFEVRLQNAAGEYRWLQWKTADYGKELLLIGRDQTERREAEQALGDAYQKLTVYMMNSPLAFVEWDRALRVYYWSPEAERAFGWSADEVLDHHPEDWPFLADEDSAEFLSVIVDLLNDTGSRNTILSHHLRADGSTMLCEWYHSALRDESGQVASIFSLALDVTERKKAEAELLKIRKAVESASDAICIADTSGQVIHLNRAFTELFGYSLTQINAKGVDTLILDATIKGEVAAAIAGGQPWKGEAQITDRYGKSLPVMLRTDPMLDENGQLIGQITVCTDLRERKKAENQLLHQALHDALTGLPNRSFFTQRLSQAFERSQRTPIQTTCLFVDLDNFKVINDSLGHEAGDQLLQIVSERLQGTVRPEDLVARLGGDEFVILIEDIADPAQAMILATRVESQLRMPVTLAGRELFVTASIGIATKRAGHERAEDLLRDADVAMYQAKSGGKAGFVLFDPRMNAEAMDRLELEMDLRRAVERDELEVYFQPIVQLESDKITEVEALLRWHHPQRGFIGPAKFIPIAEESGLIGQLGEWILEQACTHGREWLDRYSPHPPITISVNLSTRQLQQDDIVDKVSAILEKTGLPSSQLKLEITESIMLLDSEATISKLHALKALGIRLAVDDFGTGYSSMAYLSSLPVDTLKIDRAFISKLGVTAEDDAIVRAIMTMAKTMGLHVTAEGIESADQLGELRSLGCDRGQGYLFAKPLSLSDFEQMLDQNQGQTAYPKPSAKRAA